MRFRYGISAKFVDVVLALTFAKILDILYLLWNHMLKKYKAPFEVPKNEEYYG